VYTRQKQKGTNDKRAQTTI